MKKLLITGASGFVGSRVVARWRNEYAVLAPSHAELDITDRESVDGYFLQHTPDVVVHLAALSKLRFHISAFTFPLAPQKLYVKLIVTFLPGALMPQL